MRWLRERGLLARVYGRSTGWKSALIRYQMLEVLAPLMQSVGYKCLLISGLEAVIRRLRILKNKPS